MYPKLIGRSAPMNGTFRVFFLRWDDWMTCHGVLEGSDGDKPLHCAIYTPPACDAWHRLKCCGFVWDDGPAFHNSGSAFKLRWNRKPVALCRLYSSVGGSGFAAPVFKIRASSGQSCHRIPGDVTSLPSTPWKIRLNYIELFGWDPGEQA